MAVIAEIGQILIGTIMKKVLLLRINFIQRDLFQVLDPMTGVANQFAMFTKGELLGYHHLIRELNLHWVV
jgi:hypothetical protein